LGKRRELAIVAVRQVLPDGADLGLYDVEVIEQPLRRRRDELASVDVVGKRVVREPQQTGVFAQTRLQALRAPLGTCDRESGRERLGALFEPLDAQQLIAKRFLDGGRRATQWTGPGRHNGFKVQCRARAWVMGS
jgi:hypothetical protein